MPQNLSNAYAQWVKRSPDEIFKSLEDMHAFAESRKISSFQRINQLEDLVLGVSPDNELKLNPTNEQAQLTHWAFGQLCTRIGAPAKYLRALPADMTRDCLQYNLKDSDQKCKILYRNSNGSDKRIVSAFTGPSYGRIWDVDVLENLIESTQGSHWHVPGAKYGRSTNTGLYASDHDMFVFMINDQNPIEIGNSRLGKGFFCWNSETGASTFGLTTFLYNFVCDNHIVYGAENIEELKIFHRSKARDKFKQIAIPALYRFAENKSLSDNIKSTVNKAMNYKIGDDIKNVQEWFTKRPFTNKEITTAWENGLMQGENVSTLWGMIQGLTAYARNIPYTDKRVNLERRAGSLLRLGI